MYFKGNDEITIGLIKLPDISSLDGTQDIFSLVWYFSIGVTIKERNEIESGHTIYKNWCKYNNLPWYHNL